MYVAFYNKQNWVSFINWNFRFQKFHPKFDMGFALLGEKWMIVLLSKDHEEEGISIGKLRWNKEAEGLLLCSKAILRWTIRAYAQLQPSTDSSY